MIATQPAPTPQEQRLRLSAVPWKSYIAIREGLGERRIRVTYDQGELEIMSVSFKHENRKSRLGRFVGVLAEELEIEMVFGGSMTCRNEKMERALEPDECYWIANEHLVRDRDEIDFETDPPPDLSLEIEISRSTLNRMGIYASLGVPEVWRWDGETLNVHLLGARGTYRISKRSKSFPFLPLDEFNTFLSRTDLTNVQLIRAFRNWVVEQKDEWGF